MVYGVFIDAEAGKETVIVSIRQQEINREGFHNNGKRLRCKSGESAKRWVEQNFDEVTWCVIDRYTPKGRVGWAVVEASPETVANVR